MMLLLLHIHSIHPNLLSPYPHLTSTNTLSPPLPSQQSRLDYYCDVAAVPTNSPFASCLSYVQKLEPLIEREIYESEEALQGRGEPYYYDDILSPSPSHILLIPSPPPPLISYYHILSTHPIISSISFLNNPTHAHTHIYIHTHPPTLINAHYKV